MTLRFVWPPVAAALLILQCFGSFVKTKLSAAWCSGTGLKVHQSNKSSEW